VLIAGCNLVGSLVGGRLADRVPQGVLLATLALMTTLALGCLAIFEQSLGGVVGFGLIGFAYGGTIAAYPAVIAKRVGMAQSARVYGRIFTAWGSAGLIGPWFAGWLFDWSGDYQLALIAAGAFGMMSVGAVLIVFRQNGAK
jgi:OFA family oxalate/formate antiporter-like MFS transporter